MRITNITGSPVQVSDDGGQLDGQATTDLDPSVSWVDAALRAGALVEVTEPQPTTKAAQKAATNPKGQ